MYPTNHFRFDIVHFGQRPKQWKKSFKLVPTVQLFNMVKNMTLSLNLYPMLAKARSLSIHDLIKGPLTDAKGAEMQ